MVEGFRVQGQDVWGFGVLVFQVQGLGVGVKPGLTM